MAKNKHQAFDKYFYYLNAVQSPDVDCDFIAQTYKNMRNKAPRILREDFCGTHAICCEWVKRNNSNYAFGIDLDPEPLAYGQAYYASKLREDQVSRLAILQGNVISTPTPKADVTAALNFSYYLFKNRTGLRHYFKTSLKSLKKDGLLIVDAFGGPDTLLPLEEKTRIKWGGGFEYFWEQMNFNPISHEALFYIHFKRPGERKRERVFKYDWRMWTLPEIREIMMEAGFRRTHVYWEGSNKRGLGNGIFKRSEKGEDCDAWIAYVVGEA